LAIYSCNLRSIGRTTHSEGTAGAHLRYISRPGENPIILAEHMPTDGNDARAWMNAQESTDRKNARVCDKIRIALPRELTQEQRADVVRDFMSDLTKGNSVPWYAAFHDTAEDAHNPHVHVVVRDRHIETGKRILGLSDSKRDWIKKGNSAPSPSHHVREMWETHANAALEKAGHDVRVDRRTLEAQGIEREPQIHEGVNARKIDSMVQRPRSKAKITGNGRTIDYPAIDDGKTRIERNAEIIDLNLERAARSPDFATRVLAEHEKAQAVEDRKLKAWISGRERTRTQDKRRTKRDYRSAEQSIRKTRDADLAATKADLNALHLQRMRDLKEKQAVDSGALKARQSKLSSRLFAIFDLTGKTRKQRKAERADLKRSQVDARRALVQSHRKTKETRLAAISERNKAALEANAKDRAFALQRHANGHEAQILQEQDSLQSREIDRESDLRAVQQQINIAKREAGAKEIRRAHASGGFARAVQHESGDAASPAPSNDDLKPVRSPNRKRRIRGEKSKRVQKIRAARKALQEQRGDPIIRNDFNPASVEQDDKAAREKREQAIKRREDKAGQDKDNGPTHER